MPFFAANISLMSNSYHQSRTVLRAFVTILGYVRWAGVTMTIAVAGCGTSPPEEGLLNKALALVGLQEKVDIAAVPAIPHGLVNPVAPTRIALRIHASDQLNSSAGKHPLSLVVKVYKLTGSDAFSRTTYQDFATGKDLGDEVLASREVVLIPGQRYEVKESLPKDTAFVGVVALFRSPAEAHWRFVFDVAKSARTGLMLGAHQCALSVTQGTVVGSSPEGLRLAGVVCPTP